MPRKYLFTDVLKRYLTPQALQELETGYENSVMKRGAKDRFNFLKVIPTPFEMQLLYVFLTDQKQTAGELARAAGLTYHKMKDKVYGTALRLLYQNQNLIDLMRMPQK